MAVLWFPRISCIGIPTTNLVLLFGDAIRRQNQITILRLNEMATLWFPMISRMGILTTNLVCCFEDDHIQELAGFVKQLHVIGGAFLCVEIR